MKKESVKNFYKIWKEYGLNLIIKSTLKYII